MFIWNLKIVGYFSKTSDINIYYTFFSIADHERLATLFPVLSIVCEIVFIFSLYKLVCKEVTIVI